MFVFEVIKALEKEKIKYAIAGGYAMAFHKIVRATIDVDILITFNKAQFKALERAMHSIGLQSKLPINAEDIYNFRQEYIENRNLIAWSFVDYKKPHRIVDILLTNTVNDFKVDRVSIKSKKINVVSLDSLYSMKKKTGREKDKLDLKLIEEKMRSK